MKQQSSQMRKPGKVINTKKAEYYVYDFEGPSLEGVYQLDLSYDQETGHGAYMIRMEPGTITTKHIHTLREEYLILEGDIIESDGTVLGPGDYIIYEPGSEHNSRTENGALVIGFDYPSPDQLKAKRNSEVEN
jgi:quercetin dioxygenase-like cupin family protein